MEFEYLDEKTIKLWEDFRGSYVWDRVLPCADSLAMRGFSALPVPTVSEANRNIVGQIDRDQTVYYWGGGTLEELGLIDTLSARGNKVKDTLPMFQARRLSARLGRTMGEKDVYLSSVCAVTLDGILVKIQPEGLPLFRPGAEPGKIILVAGVNKIVGDINDGFRRAKDLCIPQCAERLGLDIPCVQTGRCIECDTPIPMCSVHSIVTQEPIKPKIVVVLIGERLGV